MPSFKVNPVHVMEAVYSYPFPEVRTLLDKTSLPSTFMLNTLPVGEAKTLLNAYNFSPALWLPATSEGTLDLDELHVPIIDRLRAAIQPLLPGIDTFEQCYPTPGSSHALFSLMAEWKARGELESIAVLEGEYEGYRAYANSLAIPLTTYKDLSEHPKKGEVWFISNPNAVDGNLITKEAWRIFTHAGHQIVYDAAYLGLTIDGIVDVSSPNIKAVVISPSKVYGVFRYRLTGLCFTRQPVSSLYGTKWFKDIPALLDTLLLYETFTAYELPRKYKKIQEEICNQLGAQIGSTVRASDTLLLGYANEGVGSELTKYRRKEGLYRFGLTKLFEDYENMV